MIDSYKLTKEIIKNINMVYNKVRKIYWISIRLYAVGPVMPTILHQDPQKIFIRH